MRLTHIANNVYCDQESGKLVTVLARDPVSKEYTFLMQNGGTRKYHVDEIIIEEYAKKIT